MKSPDAIGGTDAQQQEYAAKVRTEVPKPYYEDDLVTLYHGDCREVTAWLEADVLVTDPPYGRAAHIGSGLTNSLGRGNSRPSYMIAGDKDTGIRDESLSLWFGVRDLAIVFGDLLIAQPARAVQALIYAKPFDAGIRGARAGFRRDAEAIYLCGDWPLAIGGESSVLTTGGRVAGMGGMATVIGHPHTKPQDLMQTLIAHCPPGAIADPFAGSGSTLVAAKALGRKAIGVELDERYCEIAARRLAQDTLFGGVA